MQQLHDLVIVRAYGSELGVELRQLSYIFHRSAVAFITRNTSPKTRALIKAAFDNNPDCSYIVRNRAWSSAEKLTEYRYLAMSILGGRPPFPLRGNLFFSISRIFHVRPPACRYIHFSIPQRPSRLSKSADFGGACTPLRASCFPMQKTFCAAENTACCLPFANTLAFQPSLSRHGRAVQARLCSFGLSKTFRPPVGRAIEQVAVKTGKAASIYVGIVSRSKDTDLFNKLNNS